MLSLSIGFWWEGKSSAKEIWKPWDKPKDLAPQMGPLLSRPAYILSPTSSYTPHTHPAPRHAKSPAPPPSESFLIHTVLSTGIPSPSPLIEHHLWEVILISADWDRTCVLISVFPQKCLPSPSLITSFVCVHVWVPS